MKVLVVDDEMLVADLISDYLRSDNRVSEIISKYDPNDITDLIKKNSVNIVFLDLYMPNFIGLEILKQIKSKFSEVKVIVLSSHFQAKYINKALNLGASGYLSKSINKSEIKKVIDSIVEGKVYLCSTCYKELDLNKMRESNPKMKIIDLLTPREIDVLKEIADGKSSVQIGETLFISKDTVETHKKHLYEKFGVKKVTQLVKVAVENNII